MTLTSRVPIIRIGVLQSVEQVDFRCNQSFSLRSPTNKILFSGSSHKQYTLSIGFSQPAKIRYQVRAGIEQDQKRAEKWVYDLKRQGLEARARIVGVSFEINHHKIDNREYWVTIGDFITVNEAKAFRDKQDQPGEYVVVEQIVTPASGEIQLSGQNLGSQVRLVPDKPTEDTLITLAKVKIGIEFHWQRYEDLDYRGIIEIVFNNQGLLAVINELDLENYLVSVNSSEMTADCPLGLLEAQTIIARNTVLATMGKHHYNTTYHLCSDDHCQCYQGKKREQKISRQAMENTRGEIIMYGDEICDARYSKICGGIMEDFRYVWENREIPYLVMGVDSDQPIDHPANTEEKARKLIGTMVPAYCNTELYALPAKLANLYATKNLFRWQVKYTRQELEMLISEKTGQDIGELQDIISLERGASGRLIYIELVGSKKNLKIGKELQIRRVLSKSHLYSSCFYVEKEIGSDGKVNNFILKGAGWGHGVGLCQVGATVMAMKNISYQDILRHYYKDTRIIKLY